MADSSRNLPVPFVECQVRIFYHGRLLCDFKESPNTTMAFCLAKACSKLDQGKPRTEKCTTSELMCLCLSGGSAPLELGSTLGSHFPPPLTVATLVLVEKQRKQALLQSRISVKPGGMCVHVCLFLISFVVFPIILINLFFRTFPFKRKD